MSAPGPSLMNCSHILAMFSSIAVFTFVWHAHVKTLHWGVRCHSAVWFFTTFILWYGNCIKGEGFDSEATNHNGDEDDPDRDSSSDEEPQRHCGTTIAKLLSGNMLQSTRDVDQACDLWGSVCVFVENVSNLEEEKRCISSNAAATQHAFQLAPWAVCSSYFARVWTFHVSSNLSPSLRWHYCQTQPCSYWVGHGSPSKK